LLVGNIAGLTKLLSEQLRLDPVKIQTILLRRPFLLSSRSQTLANNLEGLQSAISEEQLTHLLVKNPAILVHGAKAFLTKVWRFPSTSALWNAH
jgi:hypothetical protein